MIGYDETAKPETKQRGSGSALNCLVSRESVHEVYLPDVLDRASKGLCDGACEKHGHDIKAVRVFGVDGYDWGYFSYCDVAVKEDISREMIIEDVDG